MFSPQIMVLKTFIAAAGPREAKKKRKENCVYFDVGYGRIREGCGKNR